MHHSELAWLHWIPGILIVSDEEASNFSQPKLRVNLNFKAARRGPNLLDRSGPFSVPFSVPTREDCWSLETAISKDEAPRPTVFSRPG